MIKWVFITKDHKKRCAKSRTILWKYWTGPAFRQDSEFKVTIWRKQVDQKTSEVSQKADEMIQKTSEVGQKTDEVIEKIPQVTRIRSEVDHKIEQLSQKAQQLSQKMSQKTFESILYAINNDVYVSIKTMELLANCGKTTVKRYLSFLTENGFISHIGPDKGGYRIINWSKLDAQWNMFQLDDPEVNPIKSTQSSIAFNETFSITYYPSSSCSSPLALRRWMSIEPSILWWGLLFFLMINAYSSLLIVKKWPRLRRSRSFFISAVKLSTA